mmetsp:Transcript_123534/g.293518  ORF Transcript_123534/g.293518 Transcript_123534/m.293518 type:complete len:249 (-) Transcript_123534:2161-2907(-)
MEHGELEGEEQDDEGAAAEEAVDRDPGFRVVQVNRQDTASHREHGEQLQVLDEDRHLALNVGGMQHGIQPHHGTNHSHGDHLDEGGRRKKNRDNRQQNLREELQQVCAEDLTRVGVEEGQVQVGCRTLGGLPPGVVLLPHSPVEEDARWHVVCVAGTNGVGHQRVAEEGEDDANGAQENRMVAFEAHHIWCRRQVDSVAWIAGQDLRPGSILWPDTVDGLSNGLANGDDQHRGQQLHEKIHAGSEGLC